MQVENLGEPIPNPAKLRLRKQPYKVPVYDSYGCRMTDHGKAVAKTDGTGYVKNSENVSIEMPAEDKAALIERITKSGEDPKHFAEHSHLELQFG